MADIQYIFIDVNGTMIPDNSVGFRVDSDETRKFSRIADKLASYGIRIGLCSDSPLEQLSNLARQLGLGDGIPIFAENGNLFSEGERCCTLRELDVCVRNDMVALAESIAHEMAYERVDDVIAPEFSGTRFDFTYQWGWGGNRKAGISLFGPHDFIERVGCEHQRMLGANGRGYSVDCSPEYHFLGVHPASNYRDGKRESMEWLLSHSHNEGNNVSHIWLIGDSPSDWLGNTHPTLHSCFVASSTISSDMRDGAFFVSELEYFAGVNDCLAEIGDFIKCLYSGSITQ